jgi:hypothetical protein
VEYRLRLETIYKDCEWNAELDDLTTATFTMVRPGDIVEEPEPEPEPEEVDNTTQPVVEPIEPVVIADPEDKPDDPLDEGGEGSFGFFFLLGMGVVVGAVIFLVVLILIRQSMYI